MYFIYSPGHELEARQGHSFTAKAYGLTSTSVLEKTDNYYNTSDDICSISFRFPIEDTDHVKYNTRRKT